VKISGSAYAPDIAVVRAGGKVTWINGDHTAHTAPAFPPGGPA